MLVCVFEYLIEKDLFIFLESKNAINQQLEYFDSNIIDYNDDSVVNVSTVVVL